MAHRFHLVINNPTEKDYKEIEAIVGHDAYKSHYMNNDKAPTTGTLHIHLYIEFKKKISFGAMKAMFKRAHIEKAYKDAIANELYIDKHETNPKSTEEYCMKSWTNSIKYLV